MRSLAFCVAFALALSIGPATAEDTSNLKIKLQASMQRHIERTLIDGALFLVDFESGGIARYYPAKAHTAILMGDGYYVLCADVRSEDGKSLPVDYYLAETPRGFKVFRTEISNRGPLMAMMKAGDIRKF